MSVLAHGVKPLQTHRIFGVSAEEEADHDDEVGEHQNAALEVIALSLAVHVT